MGNSEWIRRQAILIGAPGGRPNNTNFLTGVEQDLRNVERFLLSPNGGAWKKSEIRIIYHATFGNTSSAIENANADFVFVYFSGHGCCDTSNNRIISLQDKLVYGIPFFENKGTWQLSIADSCSNYSQASIGALDVEQWSSFDGSSIARQKFDNAILNAIPGRQVIFPTQAGYTTRDTIGGGNFTLALLRSAKKRRASTGHIPISVNQIVREIPKQELDYNTPTIYQSGNTVLPFAVSIPPQDNDRVARPTSPPKESVNWGGLALLTLGVIGVASLFDDK